MSKNLALAAGLLISSFHLEAQKSGLDSLAHFGRQILEHSEFSVRDSTNQWFLERLSAHLKTEAGFVDPLKSLTNVMRLQDEDQRFSLVTWQMPDRAYHYKRFGLIAVRTQDRQIKVHHLQDDLAQIENLWVQSFTPERWPGAIYYRLIPEKTGDNRFTLLGLIMEETLTRKVVEVLELKPNGEVSFGASIFRIDQIMDKTLQRPPKRLVFSYNAKYSATVNWHEEEGKIIMDHLAPPDAKMKGLYQSYGPDFSYDALYWEDGWWHLEKGVQFNSDQESKPAPPPQPLDLGPR